MSTFLLPLEISEILASAIAQFWWSSNPPKRGIYWEKNDISSVYQEKKERLVFL